MNDNTNILKVRDDYSPILFDINPDGSSYTLDESSPVPSWMPDGELSPSEIRKRVEPWLTSLFQSEHLSLLVGTGLTTSIQLLSGKGASNGMGVPELKTDYSDKLKKAVEKSAAKLHRGIPNIEDYIRVINELLRGLEILEDEEAYLELREELNQILSDFVNSISEIENNIATTEIETKTKAFNALVMFLMSFASRTGTRDRLNIFTTNYDRVIEAGAELAGLHLLDRFAGILSPIFRSSRVEIDMHYNPPGIRGEPRYLEGVARFTKLHGSIDWIETNEDIRRIGLPFGARDINAYLNAPGLVNVDPSKIMIFPNASKDRETSEYPYVELFRDFAAALCRPNSTLVTYGYGFGDEHINRIIRDMLTIPSTHLVIISYNDIGGRIIKNYEKIGRPSQISLLIGPALAEITTLTESFLPKPAIDKAATRMSELLRQRYVTESQQQPDSTMERGEPTQ